MISFVQVNKAFNGRRVLRDLSFHIESKACVGILGPSGVGKTTILRLITGAVAPDTGTVQVTETRIGYIFQEPRLLPWRTALENIALVVRATGKGTREAKTVAAEWMQRLGLKGFEQYYPAQLSGGMQQRVSIGRALAIDPELLVMDEPFSHLDMGLKESLLEMMEGLIADYRPTVAYVTHDLLEALRLADRIFRLSTGSNLEELNLDHREAVLYEYVFKHTRPAAAPKLTAC
jgi:NitT/TauT family transport system ATP-binding protein